jgi:hypothetical protein
MRGKPETEAEKRQNIRDRVEKNRKEAEYHRSRQNVLLSYFAGSPEKLDDPKVKNLLSQREYLASKYDKYADDEEKRLDAIEQKEEQQKTQKEVATIQATGRVGAAEVQAGMYGQRGQQEMMQNALDAIQEANKSFAKDDIGEDGFMTSVMTAMSPYYTQIARRNKVPIQDAIGMVHQAVQMEIDNPGQGVPILFTLLGV